jgi:hypothetical protein
LPLIENYAGACFAIVNCRFKHTHTMKKITQTILAIFLFSVSTTAQVYYTLKDPVIKIDFGSGSNISEFNAVGLANYERVEDNCPNDGFYTYTNYTSDCFNRDWFTLRGDHTGNEGGNMMLVNASESGGTFFTYILKDLKPNTTYELGVWLMNVCRINGGCSPLPPKIAISVVTFTGRVVAGFKTGRLYQGSTPSWKRYSAFFTVPSGETMLALTMSNLTTGGCGNDFAMDDITIRERVEFINEPPEPVVKQANSPAVKPVAESRKPVAKTSQPPFVPSQPEEYTTVTRKDAAPVSSVQTIEKNELSLPQPKQPSFRPAPLILTQRENPVVKSLVTAAGEMTIDLYDNGQIDGDTVTIYHNNELVVARAGLSSKAVSFKVKVNAANPHHEIVMVADNLGSIPPNTSLMLVSINGVRYDVFISSSEQKNAKVVIDLQQ